MRTVLRLLGLSVAMGLAVAACTNDYEAFSFTGTGGSSSGSGGQAGGGGSTSGGSGGTGGTATGGTGGTTTGGTGGTATGGTGGTATGGTGGTATGGTGGTATGGTGGTTSCSGNNKPCNGQCVAYNDPKYGCGPTGCDPCTLPNATTQCVSNQCALQNCTSGYDSCDQNAANGCEQKLDSTNHCGACNRKCNTLNSTGSVCTASACVHTCQTGFGDCTQPTTGPDDGCESNLTNTKDHCGSCANNCGAQGVSGGFGCKASACACTANEQCLTTGGLANSSCNTGSGLCVCDGSTCKVGETCGKTSGNTVCQCNGNAACTTGQTCCPVAGCVDMQTDENHCGGCGIKCASGKTCTAGVCQ